MNLYGKIKIKNNCPIELSVNVKDKNIFDKTISCKITSDIIPVPAINSPISEDRIKTQISKTSNTPFIFTDIKVELDDGLYISPISSLNELRRNALAEIENKIINSFTENRKSSLPLDCKISQSLNNKNSYNNKKISLLLNKLSHNIDYTKLEKVDKLYIPLKYFGNIQYKEILNNLTCSFNVYIYLPSIIKTNYRNILKNTIDKALKDFDISGFVISNIGNIELLKEYTSKYEFISNYTFNVFNLQSANILLKNGISTVTLSPELNTLELVNLCNLISEKTELIVYGNLPIMTSKYCLLGKTNKCYPECNSKCKLDNIYYLKDRLGFLFRVIPDNQQTITTIYNSKTTSIHHNDFNVDFVRIDIIDENIDQINNIISIVQSGKKLEGEAYTNGNLNKLV